MITTEDLQKLNRAVADARNAKPFDQQRYDTAHAEYMAAIQRWEQEGKTLSDSIRAALKLKR